MSSKTRQTGSTLGRSVASRKSSPSFAFPEGSVRRDPVAELTGPGSFCTTFPRRVCMVPKPGTIPAARIHIDIAPLERKSRFGASAIRSYFYEQSHLI